MTKPVLFFDLGNTLGVAQLQGTSLTRIQVFPFVPQILARLQKKCRLGILSNTGNESLQHLQQILVDAGLTQFFDAPLQFFSSVEGMDKSSVQIFQHAVSRAGVPAAQCVYVSEDDAERAMARQAGMRVSFHALHVFDILQSMGTVV